MDDHKYVTVYAGEQWCDTHDSAFPCPVDESTFASALNECTCSSNPNRSEGAGR